MLENPVEVTLPPWALPREEITLYVRMQKDVDFSKVVIDLPECFEIKDTINVINLENHDNIIEVIEIGRPESVSIDYFGIVISSTQPFDELAKEIKIPVTIIDKNGNKTDYISHARIFRPLLEIEQIPDEIKLNDTEDSTLPIHLKFKGFGDISIRIEAKIAGNLVSEGGTSIVDKVFDDFLKEGILQKHLPSENDLGIEINKTAMVRILDDFKTRIKDKDYLDKMTQNKDVTREVRQLLEEFNSSDQEKTMKILYDTVEGQLIRKLTNLLKRSVSCNVNLDSGTKISTELKADITNLTLKIFYKDLANNVYEPLVKTLSIIDNRKIDPEIRVTIPIEVEKVNDSEKYQNVEKMEIGSLV